ncbi:MAG: hypothetical protein R3B82_14360 [Sandaracinaceae bacterium]
MRPHRDVLLPIPPSTRSAGPRRSGPRLERHASYVGEPWAVLDEGSFVASDFLPNRWIVLIAVAEKRYVTIRLSVVAEAGH